MIQHVFLKYLQENEILNIFLIISGSHIGLSLKYHIPAFVNF